MPEQLKRMDEIEKAIGAAAPGASPKAQEGFALLTRMINDTRDLYKKAVPDSAALAEAITKLK